MPEMFQSGGQKVLYILTENDLILLITNIAYYLLNCLRKLYGYT